jgi:Tol biopolymer transport system component
MLSFNSSPMRVLLVLGGLLLVAALAPGGASGTVVYADAECYPPGATSVTFMGCGRVVTSADDGSGERLLVRFASQPACAPDGTRVAYAHTSAVGVSPGVGVVNIDGTGVTRLTTFGYYPEWSPDGERLAFYDEIAGTSRSRAAIYAVSARDGSGLRQVTDPLAARSFDSTPAFAPDGRIVFTRSSEADRESNLWVVNPDGTGARQLTRGGLIGGAEYSPDGRRLMFLHFVSASRTPTIYIMDADGRNLRRMADGFFPNWAPDGRSIIFVREENPPGSDSVYNTWRLDLAAGAVPVALTHRTEALVGASTPDPCGTGPLPPPPAGTDSVPPSVIVFGSTGPVSAAGVGRPAAVAVVGSVPRLTTLASALKFGTIDRTGVGSSAVSIARRARGRCAFVGRKGFGKPAACEKPQFVDVRTQLDFARLTRHLRKGTYELQAKTTDVNGNRTRAFPRLELRVTGR